MVDGETSEYQTQDDRSRKLETKEYQTRRLEISCGCLRNLLRKKIKELRGNKSRKKAKDNVKDVPLCSLPGQRGEKCGRVFLFIETRAAATATFAPCYPQHRTAFDMKSTESSMAKFLENYRYLLKISTNETRAIS